MRYKIADLVVDMDVKYPRLTSQCKKYKYDGDLKTNMKIRFRDGLFDEHAPQFPEIGADGLEYLWTGAEFYNLLIQFGGMMLHSSCVVYKDRAYLFSAPCGTGKSTHTQLWLKQFPGSYILNDDKPAIRIMPDGIYAYGTPFSGKTDLSVDKGVKIGGICILARGEKNSISRVSTDEALTVILNQTIRPNKEDGMDKLLKILDRVLSRVPVYRLYCNMEPVAAEVSYNGMKDETEEM